MKKKILLTAGLLLATPVAHAAFPIIPVLFWGIVAGAATSTGLGIYCATAGCANNTNPRENKKTTTPVTTVGTTKIPATVATPKPTILDQAVALTPTTSSPTTSSSTILNQAVNSVVQMECNRASRPSNPSIEIAIAAIARIEHEVHALSNSAAEIDNSVLHYLIDVRTTLCYLNRIMENTRPGLRYDSQAPNAAEHVNTLLRASDVLNRSHVLLRQLLELYGERRLNYRHFSEVSQIKQYQMEGYSMVFNFLNQGNNQMAQPTGQATYPMDLVNFRLALVNRYRETLVNFFSHNALRIAREQYAYGLASGEIISDEVRGGFTERINTMLNEADAGLINILRANARPFLQEELAPHNEIINWQRVQNRLIEVATETYDRIFVRITCINPVNTAALQQACAEHNQWRQNPHAE